jgi:hypothetical protein
MIIRKLFAVITLIDFLNSNENAFNWDTELVYNPDRELAKSPHVVVSSDGWILEQVAAWYNLGAYIIENHIKDGNIIEV